MGENTLLGAEVEREQGGRGEEWVGFARKVR